MDESLNAYIKYYNENIVEYNKYIFEEYFGMTDDEEQDETEIW